MTAADDSDGSGGGASGQEGHPSLADRFDPAIRDVEYDAARPTVAEAELSPIAPLLGPVAARPARVGSTSVPGLAVKSIIDSAVFSTARSRGRPSGRVAMSARSSRSGARTGRSRSPA